MKRNNTFRWVVVVLFVAWAISSIYPPTSKNLYETFKEEAANRDAAFTNILSRADQLEKEFPNRGYNNLKAAAGTNELNKYFAFDVKSELDQNAAVLNKLQRKGAGKVKLGLDLQGGTEFLVALDNSRASQDTNKVKLDDSERTRLTSQAIEVLRKRVDKFGVAEPVLQPSGNDRIIIQLPGLSEVDKQAARNQIEKAAFLEFRMVHEQSDELLKEGRIPPDYEVLREKMVSKTGEVTYYPMLVQKKLANNLTGKYIKRAYVIRDDISNTPQIAFELNSEGAPLFAQVTRENVGRKLGIVLDGELYSAPVINGEIPNGRGTITLGLNPDVKSAFDLANVLENPLETPVHIIKSQEVEPSLGKDNIRNGIRSAFIGVVAVAGFMLVYYMWGGLIANIALLVNLLMLVGVMCSVGTTFTLPGIAGIVLTVGMAVDANVLIFERIREELALGKSLRGALAAGYDKAFSTIFDSHLTTLISSVILIYMGTGSVKGFGVALTIGVALSLFTSLVITRLIFDWLIDRNILKTLPMLHLIRGAHFDFMRLAKVAFALTWILIVIGIGYGVHRGNKVMGIDFAGGDSTTLAFKEKIDQGKIHDVLTKANQPDAQIQYQRDPASNTERLQVVTAFNTGQSVVAGLTSAFPNAGFTVLGSDRVGPVVGEEILKSAITASLMAMAGILIYIAFRYEFSFAVGAIVAVIHDILMTLGWFFLTGRQLNAPMVAAILTIIGFSLNDTIVIFDRIREDLKLGVKGSFKDVMNRALNQTLSRTIITSGTVFLATLSLFLFGGGVIEDFAFTFLVGILTGTYSSIYIASAIVLWWHKGQRPVAIQTGTPVNNVIEA
ncbi:MAG: protein-export rane protein SecD [Verrucomicrobiales bacterium]|nr:protein-export rane protein SecD [Verrucomicrobiales bacterium]